MTARDRHISEQVAKVPETILAVVLAGGFFYNHASLTGTFSTSHVFGILALLVIYTAATLNLIDRAVVLALRPYDFSRQNPHRLQEESRVCLDVLTAGVYAYLIVITAPLGNNASLWFGDYILGFAALFALYSFSGVVRRFSQGALATNVSPLLIATLAYIVVYALYEVYFYRGNPSSRLWLNILAVSLTLGIMAAYRSGRSLLAAHRNRLKTSGLVIAVDIDGVLANQIVGVLPRIRARLGINLKYDDITEFRMKLGDSDIAKEITSAYEDPDYILTMPVHRGARDLVDSLYRRNEVVLLTARPPVTKSLTLQWLDRNGFTFDRLLNVTEETKGLYGSDVLIDDYVGNIRQYLDRASGLAILVSQPWNQDAPKELAEWQASNRLCIVKGLEEARDIVENLARKKQKGLYE